MAIELRWMVSQATSCFHAVDAIHRGCQFADETLHSAIQEPAQALLGEIQAAGIPLDKMLCFLTGLSAGIPNARELVEVSLRKTRGNVGSDDPVVNAVAGRIRDVENAVRRVYPKMLDDLALRAGPLKEQWEARGPGLLKLIGKLTDEQLIVANAEVVLVQPVLGGGGAAHLFNNSVRIEGVLVNPEPRLPEVSRLAWLISQLNQDLPMYSEKVSTERLEFIAPLAMLPATLAASEVVELARLDLPTIELALQTWRLKLSATVTVNVAETSLSWWETYQESRPAWPVALAALDKMIG